MAERLLAHLMQWDVVELKTRAPGLQALAALKYDEYGQYHPGVKFVESLAIWLQQFDPGTERAVALQFIEEELLFITDRELGHLIALAAQDNVEEIIRTDVAQQLSLRPWCTKSIIESEFFRVARRRNLFLGLSDGARLDRFRRASPTLSHEQFVQEYQVSVDVIRPLSLELASALRGLKFEGSATFNRIWLIDDFAGSGRTLIRPDPDFPGSHKGKLPKFADRLEELTRSELVDVDSRVDILLYVATEQAIEHVEATLADAALDRWQLHVTYRLPDSAKVNTASQFADLCRRYYDPETEDKYKKETSLGYSDCALPLVLSHNTPNNSVCLLWAETGPAPPALNRRALFPRYERHHRDRP